MIERDEDEGPEEDFDDLDELFQGEDEELENDEDYDAELNADRLLGPAGTRRLRAGRRILRRLRKRIVLKPAWARNQQGRTTMTTTTYTAEAKELLGEFVQRAGKSFLVVKASDVFGEPTTIRITPGNLAEFYATEANNLSSGIRTLAGLYGDWRPISELANLALDWFKSVNVEGMRRAARRAGLTPKF